MIIYDYFHDYRKKLQYQCHRENLPKLVCIDVALHLDE